jgi:cell fate (sporulation/competence/biofilm development) regulator YlbF (YheA/YmcA/DUF963 family)
MDAIEKAVELGNAIAASKEMVEYKKYEEEMEADDRAKELLADFKKLQIELVRATRDNKSKDEIDDCKNRLLSKQAEINDYGTTRNYLEAKSAFDGLMKRVNEVIIFTVTGEEPCSPKKCNSCSGCK